MAELARIIHALAQDENDISVGELSELVQKDETVLEKVISAANTFGYNPSGVQILNLTEAIHIIGFARVRRLAMSLLLLEHAGRATSPEEQREMAALSLCSAVIAEVAAEKMTLVDPEQAFVCAALRNFGRLVLGSVMKDEFREARELAERDGSDDEAFRTIFGLTPLELGHELFRSSALPAPILNAIRDLPPEILEATAWAERRLAHLARFSLQMSELVLNAHLSPADFGIAARELVERYAAELPALKDIFPDLLRQAEARLTVIARSAGGGSLNNYGLERLRQRVARDGPPTRAPARSSSSRPPIVPSRAVSSLEEANALLAHAGPAQDPVGIALLALQITLQASELFYCALDSAQGEFRLEQGHGPLAQTLLGKPLFRRHERNVFLLCHERLENVVVRDATDSKLQPYLPAWLRTAEAPRSFILLPLHHLGRVQGVFLVGWPDAHPINLPAERIAAVRKLLASAARAAVAPQT